MGQQRPDIAVATTRVQKNTLSINSSTTLA